MFGMTGRSDKELFECSYPEWQEKRIDTTFFDDFSIADAFGPSAVRDTYKRSFESWSNYAEYFTELTAVLNHKLWQHYNAGRMELAKVYDGLWKKANAYGRGHFKGKDLEFFVFVLD